VFDNATFAGTYTFDSTMPQVLATPSSGGYAGNGGIFNMNVAFTGTLDASIDGPYIADMLNITVNNNFPGPLDEYLVTGTSSTDSTLSIEIRLDDFSGTAFSNTSLPLTPPVLPLLPRFPSRSSTAASITRSRPRACCAHCNAPQAAVAPCRSQMQCCCLASR
jgi:hypothetical protein